MSLERQSNLCNIVSVDLETISCAESPDVCLQSGQQGIKLIEVLDIKRVLMFTPFQSRQVNSTSDSEVKSVHNLKLIAK